MANTRDIRRRIKSVKNTAQITKAMQMVAASKMKRAQDQALAGRAYASELNTVLISLKDKVAGDLEHPLLQEREVKRELLLVISTDKGLCGALNTNITKKVLGASNSETVFVTLGSKLRRTIVKLGRNLHADFTIKDPIPYSDTKRISKLLMEMFLSGEVDRVRVVFTHFVNTLSQEVQVETLLPVTSLSFGKKAKAAAEAATLASDPSLQTGGVLFEPNPASVLEALLPQYINFILYQMALEARASEHSARMVAMKSATDNAKGLIKDLTLEYNKLRQASITNELLEISTAQKALE